MCILIYTHTNTKIKIGPTSEDVASLKWRAGGEGHAWPVCRLKWTVCQAQEQRPGEIGRTGRSGGWETGKAHAASAQLGVAKQKPGRKGWVISSHKPLGNLQQQGLCSACWLARRCFVALLGFHSNELKTLAR